MKLSVHAIPHQSFLSIGSEVPIAKKSSFPPGEAKWGLYVFAWDFIKEQVPTAKPLSQPRWGCQLPFQGRFSRGPLWGKCRNSGKGGAVGIFELFPFNEPHPLSQAVRPASSPTGEPRGMVRIRLRFYKRVGAYRTPSATRQEPPDGGCSLAWRLRAHKSGRSACQLPHRGAKVPYVFNR